MRNIKPLLLLLCLAIASLAFAQQEVQLTNIKAVNTDRLDFSPVPFQNGIIFTSSKSDRFLKCPSDNPGDYTDVFFAPKNEDGTFGEKEMLDGDINGKYNDGVVSLSPDGKKMIFTRNNISGKNAQNIIDLKLYSADLMDDDWENVTALPFSSDDWSTAHPALSKDGTLLVFSSNRPGSTESSMDLWSARLENGVWSLPENLGPALNTSGSEIFPYIDEFNNLFFSSNGHGGAGGLDIFAARMGADGQWEMIGNIGAPFNQGGDDVSYVPLNSGTEGYYAGDRSGGEGLDDIYYWTYKPEMMDVQILVVDKQTSDPLPGATVAIVPFEFENMLDKIYGGGDAANPLNLIADAAGLVTFEARKGTKYTINTSKETYKPDQREVPYDQLIATQPYIIPLEKEYAMLTVLVVEDPTNNPIPLADIKILDKNTGKVISLTGDGEGTARSQIDCSHDYEISASKRPYYDNSVTLADYKLDCADGEVTVIVPLKKPLEVVLDPIFYNFDRYFIRSWDAKPTLDTLIQIMNRYPSLQISLNAHADARGPSSYNTILSQKRANAAMKYLMERGIDKSRVTVKEFGESNPVNNCTDEVYCPESDHQLNRRVDVVPVRHQESGVEFVTPDVKSMKVKSDR